MSQPASAATPDAAGSAGATTTCSIVIPVYRNEATIPALLERLADLSGRLQGRLELVFVVDGSPDRSYELLQQLLERSGLPAELVALSRNFGSFAAIRAGLSVARGPLFAVMAADLQEPPELVLEFFRALEQEPVDLVVGIRLSRADPRLSRAGSSAFWGLYRRFVQPAMPPGGIDMFGCNAAVRDALLAITEMNTSLVGLLVWLGFRRKTVGYHRLPRPSGRSGWSFTRKLRYMMDSIFSFTDLPITLLLVTGAGGIALTMIFSAVVAVAWVTGAVQVAGYTPIVLILLLSLFVLVLSLGVIGTYVWRTYENTKGRPLFVPMQQTSYGKGRADDSLRS